MVTGSRLPGRLSARLCRLCPDVTSAAGLGLTAHCAPCPQYDAKLRGYLQEYEKAFLVHADNVGSRQFMDIRAVRGFWRLLNGEHFGLYILSVILPCTSNCSDAGTGSSLADTS